LGREKGKEGKDVKEGRSSPQSFLKVGAIWSASMDLRLLLSSQYVIVCKSFLLHRLSMSTIVKCDLD